MAADVERWDRMLPLSGPRRQMSTRALLPLATACFLISLLHLTNVSGPCNCLKWPDSSGPAARDGDRIPRKLFYKVGPKGRGGEKDKSQTCIDKNPDYEVTFFDDTTSDEFVIRHFSDRPDLVRTFLSLSVPILKADIFRYLVLYVEGGVYSDLDVECTDVPISSWYPSHLTPSFVGGWEIDSDIPLDSERQFCTWILLARAGCPHLLAAVLKIMADIHALTIKLKLDSPSELNMSNIDVITLTGPMQLTRAVFASLQTQLGGPIDRKEKGLYHLVEQKIIGDVLIMPAHQVARFINQGYSEEEKGRLPPELVMHGWAGSWKNPAGSEVAEQTF